MILILISEVWTEEMKLFALHNSTLQNYDLLIPFLFGPDPDPQIYADPCESGSETLVYNNDNQIVRNRYLNLTWRMWLQHKGKVGLVIIIIMVYHKDISFKDITLKSYQGKVTFFILCF